MNTQKANQLYIEYVQSELAASRMPLAFPDWTAMITAQREAVKTHHVVLWSDVMNAHVGFHIPTIDQPAAFTEARRLLSQIEVKYKIETDGTGRVLSDEEQIAILQRRIEKLQESQRRQEERDAARVQKLLDKYVNPMKVVPNAVESSNDNDQSLRETINRMFWEEKKTIPAISKKLSIPLSIVQTVCNDFLAS